MTTESLSSRLQALSNTYKQTLQLIQRLQKLPSDLGSSTSSLVEDGDARVELSAEIHQSLKDQEEELELLRQEADDVPPPIGGQRWVGGGSVVRRESSREQEREVIASQVARLGEDLKL